MSESYPTSPEELERWMNLLPDEFILRLHNFMRQELYTIGLVVDCIQSNEKVAAMVLDNLSLKESENDDYRTVRAMTDDIRNPVDRLTQLFNILIKFAYRHRDV